ncbi:extensin family protein [Mesorhizobium sp. M7A.F.Ca.US.010.02.1.1]|nr:extensin family protein [Mesorhizobium sp. M7A.F.Ca.US.010.02.1.1]
MTITVLLVMPAEARHRHRHHEPLTPRIEQPLTPRAEQPLKPRGGKRLKPRRHRSVTPKQAQQKTLPPLPLPADVPMPRPGISGSGPAIPVPEPRPADAAKTAGAPDRSNEEKSRQEKQALPEPSAPEPSADTESEPEPPAVAPTPTPKPDIAEPEAQPPNIGPQPSQKPADADDEKMLPDPRSADLPDEKMPAEEVACRERLKTLGVEFEEHKAESQPEIGCSIPYPIVLKTLGKSVAIGPGAELNCKMAEAAARFAADVIQPAAKAEFGADLKSIGQASAFVCRPRNGTRKLSEHAFGNALDIASFTLSDGKKIEVGPAPPEKDAKFLNAVRKAACGPFKTVLGPGADPDHSLHFHLDLEPRRHGGTFCQ